MSSVPPRWQFFGRRRRPDGDALDRSLTHFRVVIGLAAVVLSGWSLQRDQDVVNGIGVAAGLGIILFAATERLLRRRIDALRLSAVMMAIDTAMLLVILGLNGVEPGDPASVLLVLPLIQAGIRHGVFGVIVVWTATAMALFGELAIHWNGNPEQAQAPMKLAMILLAVGVPAGRLAEHLANRLGSAQDEHSRLELRGETLMTVFEGAAAMSSAGNGIDNTLVRFAAEIVAGDARIIAATQQRPGNGNAVVADSAEGAGVVVEIGLGGTPPRMLEVTAQSAPNALAIEALELLAANHRTLAGRQSDDVGDRHLKTPVETPAETRVEVELTVPDAAPMPAVAPIGRSIGDLLDDEIPSGGVLDRPELNSVVADLLGAPDRKSLGMVLVSLDNLKLLNDLHGRAAGNCLIEATTGRLAGIPASCAPIIGWMGGDDFVAVFPDLDGLDAPTLATTVRSALSGSVDLGAFGTTPIHAGIGAAIAEGETTGPMLMRVATEQMVADRREQNRRFLADAEFELALHADDLPDLRFDDTSPTVRP